MLRFQDPRSNVFFKCAILMLITFSCSVNYAHSQTITEVLITQTKKYNPFFSMRSGSINFDFTRSYILGSQDTSYLFMVKVNEKSLEEKGYSIGNSVFSSGFLLGVAGSSNVAYDIQKSSGFEVFEKVDFEQLYDCLTSVYEHITQLASYSNSQINTMATCSCKSLTFGGEYLPKSVSTDNAKFYFQVNSESSFSMSKTEFEDLAKLFLRVKKSWP